MSNTKLTREEYRKQKDLEEARKSGLAPAERDEEGNEINPHIPQYMSKAPWYLETGMPSLRHQRALREKPVESKDEWYARGVRAGPAAVKYRKGACENCGAISHKTKECMERPRKIGAKYTNQDIQADEIVQSFELGFEGKRDRWNGYDPAAYKKVIEDWEQVEETRRKLKEKELEEQLLRKQSQQKNDLDQLSDSDDAAVDDEDKYADEADMPGQRVDQKSRTTVRNLRLREDTAKYLVNLDPNSAYYDPKTRSMRANPQPDKNPENLSYAGDNFVRWSGDAPEFTKMQVFAWNAADRGVDVNLQADPTRASMLHKEFSKAKEEVKTAVKQNIIDKYGGEQHLEAPPKELLLAQTEEYVEYSRSGKIIKGHERAQARSKYDEDNFEKYASGHTAVWGSYFDSVNRKWGYACCHATYRRAFCTGEAGLKADSEKIISNPSDTTSSSKPKTLVDLHVDKMIEQMKDRKRKAEED